MFLTFFGGHGNFRQLCHEQVFMRYDIDSLYNALKLPFSHFWSCGVANCEYKMRGEMVNDQLCKDILFQGITEVVSGNWGQEFFIPMSDSIEDPLICGEHGKITIFAVNDSCGSAAVETVIIAPGGTNPEDTVGPLIQLFANGVPLDNGDTVPTEFRLSGMAAAGITMAVKETHGILNCFQYVLYLFTPIRYPVNIHPVTRTVSLFIPLTHALVALRGIMLDIPVNLWKNALLLLAVDCVIVPLGFFIFYHIDKLIRRKGTLALY